MQDSKSLSKHVSADVIFIFMSLKISTFENQVFACAVLHLLV